MQIGQTCNLYKTCKDCGRFYHHSKFKSKGKGKRRAYCRSCEEKRDVAKRKRNVNMTLKEGKKILLRTKTPSGRMFGQKVEYEKARKMVEDGMARIINSTMIMREFDYDTFKQRIFERDGYRCVYCGRPGTSLDHILPKNMGGETSESNVVVACRRCNKIKSDFLLDDFLFSFEPYEERMDVTVEQYLGYVFGELYLLLRDLSQGLRVYTAIIERQHTVGLLNEISMLEKSVRDLKMSVSKSKVR